MKAVAEPAKGEASLRAWHSTPVTRLTFEQPPQRDQPATGAAPLASAVADALVAEVPVALVFNGISHAVMMATPTALEQMALGFALSEGLIDHANQCLGIEVRHDACTPAKLLGYAGATEPLGIEVHLSITARAEARLKLRRRSMEGRTGCGLCGIESLSALQLHPPPLRVRPSAEVDWAQAALRALTQLPGHQPLNAQTGACHAAAWATPQGQVLLAHEDVGRHNALDKLIGDLAQKGLLGQTGEAAQPGLVVMSSRASVELVRKCAQVQLGVLATISAPTSLAVSVARQAGVHLLGFCRQASVVVYSAASAPSR